MQYYICFTFKHTESWEETNKPAKMYVTRPLPCQFIDGKPKLFFIKKQKKNENKQRASVCADYWHLNAQQTT